MTLRGQLLTGITLLFTVIFLGLLTETLTSMRSYLEHQLASHAQDASTALAFPLSRALEKNDLVLAEAAINVFVDRPYFQAITVYSLDGQVVIRRTIPTPLQAVPAWFLSLVKLVPSSGQTLLNGSWRQLGRVVVVSQPLYAYHQLWKSTLSLVTWVGLVYLAALMFIVILLKVVLAPLRAIENAAVAIIQKRFDKIDLRPRTRELARVVRAMNEMITHIAGYLDAEEERAEVFRKEVYLDGVTGLENRLSFDSKLGQLLAGEHAFALGALLAVDIEGLKEFNMRNGYRAGDELLAALADRFQQLLCKQAILISRIGGASLAAILLEHTEEEIVALARRLQQTLAEVFSQLATAGELPYGVGVALFNPGENRAQILTRLDLATEAARHFGGHRLQIRKPSASSSEGLGSLGWRQLIMDALISSRWVLYAQPVIRLHDRHIIHSEVVARLAINSNELVPAAQFLPMAARHQLLPDVERALLDLAIEALAKRHAQVPLALNITFDGLLFGPGALERLSEQIRSQAAKKASLLSFEVSEFHFLSHLEQCGKVVECVRAFGCKFGIDQFGFDKRALQALRKIPIDYIKLDGGLLRDTVDNDGVRELVSSIIQLAHSLGIMVIAQGIESEHMLPLIQDMGVTAGQGYYFGHPDLL